MTSPSVTAKVMVVDDDAEYACLLVDCFSGLGFPVLYVNSGPAAIAEMTSFRPEIVLLDIRMPEMDGFEVCRTIRQNPEHANVIIIMLTSVGEVEDKIKGIDIGANDYVVKPFGLAELFEVVARVNRFLDTKSSYLRKLEEEKFATLRVAANTVCHEINNPLTAIVGSARLLAKQLQREKGDGLYSETVSILEAAQRIQNITHQLARAVRLVTTEPVPGVKMIDLDASAKQE
jgi:DNA-binding response OmpR family regulator